MADSGIKTCSDCAANVYPEHISSGRAGFHDGKLLCAVCLEEKMEELGANEEPEEALTLVGSEDSTEPTDGMAKIQRTGEKGGIGAARSMEADDSKLHRKVRDTGQGATRCRTFHSKLNESALAYMNEHINEWVDKHDDVDIKFASTVVGVFEGKHPEPNLLITLFY